MTYFLFSVGNNITGQEVTTTPTHADLILGTLIVVVAVWLVITCGLRRDASGGNPLGVSLICFGLLFTAMITAGRAWTATGSQAGTRCSSYSYGSGAIWCCWTATATRGAQPTESVPVGERTDD